MASYFASFGVLIAKLYYVLIFIIIFHHYLSVLVAFHFSNFLLLFRLHMLARLVVWRRAAEMVRNTMQGCCLKLPRKVGSLHYCFPRRGHKSHLPCLIVTLDRNLGFDYVSPRFTLFQSCSLLLVWSVFFRHIILLIIVQKSLRLVCHWTHICNYYLFLSATKLPLLRLGHDYVAKWRNSFRWSNYREVRSWIVQ